MMNLKSKFLMESSYDVEWKLIVVAVKLPSGAIETITNTDEIPDKIDYYIKNYDEEFRHKGNKEIRIVGYMLV